MTDPARKPPASDRFRDELVRALDAWRHQGRTADCVGPLIGWLLARIGAERAFFVEVGDDDSYRFRYTLDTDGEAVPEPARWISHFAIRRTFERGRDDHVEFDVLTEPVPPSLFEDTRLDRRFRTEGGRTRSILVWPIVDEERRAVLYFDTRFHPIVFDAFGDRDVAIAVDLLLVWLRLDGSDTEKRTLKRRIERLRKQHNDRQSETRPVVKRTEGADREIDFHGFRTRCPALIASIAELRRIAKSTLAVMIEGESGTGKDVLARAIHAASGRRGPFVSMHCGSMPDSLVETELFGYAKGAFTGAEQQREGLVESARGGTLFLDDVGEMPPALQSALLRVLEEKTYRRVSGAEERDADVRVVSSSLVGPDGERAHTSLRQDLFFRLAGSCVTIPPLRERGEDISLLTRLFLTRHSDGEAASFSRDVETAMLAYHWPGNSRELENLVRRAIAFGPASFDLERFEDITGFKSAAPQLEAASGTDIKSVVDRAEREIIIRTLQAHDGNKSLAARALGLSRKTLYRRMEKHGIPL